MNTKDFFLKKAEEKEGIFIAYFPLGTPRFDNVELAKAYARGGVDLLEMGIPVDDPCNDGKVVQGAMAEARAVHTDLEWYLNEFARIREAVPDVQLEIFTYKKTFEDIGCDALIQKAKAVGADCALFTDMTDEEYEAYFKEASDPTFPMLKFLPFDSTDEYVDYVESQPFGGYVFLQAVSGATGARDSLEPELPNKIKRAQEKLSLPLAAGFGISTPEQAREVWQMGVGGIVVGSNVVSYVKEHSLEEIEAMLRSFKDALK